ncbi:gfo/Idh/MocA family oxidoreductase [Lachnospiraceae bacterium AM23-2LB]|nr:gfo/Idh/MocA family oxidoreductase [Lachnospiraceae bacterium AM23-2LB]RJW02224.1 gfo/Idh/MocA family oxidoreductase [Lachnospiraceae bacterium AM40-2BH]
MGSKKIKVGFIGCGGIANSKHLPGMVFYKEEVELCAFCDLIREKAESAAKKYGSENAKVYTDYKELLKDSEIDAVHVLTPNVSHCEITVAALEAGKHVLCEKPMAATAADAKKMLEARNRSGKLLTIGYQYRHFEQNAVAKKVVEAGYLGDVYYAEATNLRRRGVPTWGVFTDKEKQGGGALIDIGTHALDLALWMMNDYDVDYVVGTSFEKLGKLLEPEEQGQVFDGVPRVWDNKNFDVDDMAVGMIKMKSGAVINLKAAWAVNIDEEAGANGNASVLLAGTKGGLNTIDSQVRLNHVIANRKTVSYIGDAPANKIWTTANDPNKESKEARIWVDALKGEGELFVTAEQAYIVSAILDAIYRSSATGNPVYFDKEEI